jgi:folate-binding protein YgfZ
MQQEAYQALYQHAVCLPLEDRGIIRLSDEDRVRLLHAMCTNAVDQLQPGQGAKALFLNDKGRILAEFRVLCRDQDLLLDTEAATRELVYQHLDRYIIMDVVELEDVSQDWAVLALEGPRAGELLRSLSFVLPVADYAHTANGDALLALNSYTGAAGYRLYAPRAEAATWVEALRGAGFVPCDLATAEVVRLEHGHPRHGVEYGEQHLVHEAQLLDYVSFTKGCYLGQEIVERVRSRGNVNRLLTRLVVDSAAPPPPDTPVMAGEAESGKVLSAVFSPRLDKAIAYALVRAEHVQSANGFVVSGASAGVAASGLLG